MRILIVTNTYPPADITGVGALAVELARALGDGGHDVRVLTRTAPAGDAYAVATGGSKLGFPLRAAARFLTLAPFDLCHVHESDGTFVVLLVRLLRWLRRRRGRARLVATLQVSYVRERAVVRAVSAAGEVVSRPTREEIAFRRFRAPLHAFLGRLTARCADTVIAPSRVTAGELQADYGARVDAVVPNGLAEPAPPADRGRAEAAALRLGRPVVLYVGRLRTRKAAAVLLRAFADLVADAAKAATLVLVGDGEQRPALQAQAAALGIAERVRFEGQLRRDDIARWYRAADVFCLPSTYEGQPVAILEAMAYGLPVVATSVAGIPETVVDGETGYVVEPEDAAALTAALARLAGDDVLRARLAAASRQRFVELYRIDRVVAAYLDVYGARR